MWIQGLQRQAAAQTIFPLQKIERWGFDPEILFLARKFEFKVKEVPVAWGHSGGTRINPLIDGSRMFQEMLRIRWYDLTGKYDARPQALIAAYTLPGGLLSPMSLAEVVRRNAAHGCHSRRKQLISGDDPPRLCIEQHCSCQQASDSPTLLMQQPTSATTLRLHRLHNLLPHLRRRNRRMRFPRQIRRPRASRQNS